MIEYTENIVDFKNKPVLDAEELVITLRDLYNKGIIDGYEKVLIGKQDEDGNLVIHGNVVGIMVLAKTAKSTTNQDVKAISIIYVESPNPINN